MTKRTTSAARGTANNSGYLRAAANVEAVRLGHAEIGLNHLLLGLLVTGGPGGRLLLDAGVTLQRGRQAVQEMQARESGDQGVPAPTPSPARYDASMPSLPLSDRAQKLYDGLPFRTDEEALLVTLIEDSQVRGLLAELGVDGDALRRSASERHPAQPAGADRPDEDDDGDDALPPEPGWRYASHSQDLPVPADQVWELISDPERRAEWGVDLAAARVAGDGVVELTREDGRVVTQTEIRHVPGREIAWRLTPASGDAERTLHLTVEALGGHSRIRLRLGWPHNARGWISRRFTTWITSQQLRLQAQSIAQTAAQADDRTGDPTAGDRIGDPTTGDQTGDPITGDPITGDR